jgi:hypothetical protein
VQDFISQEKIVDVLTRIIGPGCFVRWDQCVRKRPGGVEFPWHQDNAYSRLRDEHFQFWVALTESTRENGGLSLQPAGARTRLPHTWVGNHLVCTVQAGEEVFIRAARGDVVVFSSFVLHHTGPNETDADRTTYVVEYMSLDSYDPLLRPPYFVVAADGERSGRFVKTYPGRSPRNRLSYLPLQVATRLRTGAAVTLTASQAPSAHRAKRNGRGQDARLVRAADRCPPRCSSTSPRGEQQGATSRRPIREHDAEPIKGLLMQAVHWA